jgi:SagB-type dehydrogenase family enzyme
MRNTGATIGERYWHDSLLDTVEMLSRGMGEEGSPDEPPKFKTYLGRPRLPLPQRLPLTIGTVGSAFAGGASRELDLDLLGTLLYYGYGFSRVDVGAVGGWPYHRLVPSARCFYPTELYVCIPGPGGLPCGVHHYDQLHHALVTLREDAHEEILAAAVGADLDRAAMVVVLTSHFWKTAFRYRHYAYRLCTQEAGMVAGNVLLVAAALGLGGHVHHQFLDAALDRLLGVAPGEERSMAVIPLFPAGSTPLRPRRRDGSMSASDLAATLPVIDAPFRDVPKDLSLASDVYEIDSNSVLEDTCEFTAPLPPPETNTDGHRVPLPSVGGDPDLADALRTRNSGGTLFRPLRKPIDGTALARIARYPVHSYISDIGGTPLGEVYLVVQHVDGVDVGVYRCERDGAAMSRLGSLPKDRLDATVLGPSVVDMAAVNVVCYVVTDRHRRADRHGNRGYRIAGIDAGIVAQRICVLAGAGGLAARPINGYAVREVLRLLGIEDPARTPMFQIAIGQRTINAQYEMPIVF